MTAAAARPAAIDLTRLSLRERERGFVCGGTDSGKSTLADFLGADFVARYAGRGGRRLILDSKPRYRAEYTVQGYKAARRYRHWAHGPLIPGSVVLDDPADLRLAWQTGARTVIAQGSSERPADIRRLVLTAQAFLDDSRASRPQLLQVDETLDFFHGNGAPRGGEDTITKSARAGRERGTAGLYCSQRTKGLPVTLMGELSRLYAFRIDYMADARRFQEMGAPPFGLPRREHEFVYWWKADYQRVWGPYKLALP